MNVYYRTPKKKYYGHPVSVSLNINWLTTFYCEKCGLVEEYPRSDFASVDEWRGKYKQLKHRSSSHFASGCQEVFLSQGTPDALPNDLEQTSIFDLLEVIT